MDRSPCCPTCISQYEDIHGLIYPVGSYIGTPCTDAWHRGADYDPNKFILSSDDEFFLRDEMHIAV